MGWHYKYLQLLTRRNHKAGIYKINKWKTSIAVRYVVLSQTPQGPAMGSRWRTLMPHIRNINVGVTLLPDQLSIYRAAVRLATFNSSTFAPGPPSGYLTTCFTVAQAHLELLLKVCPVQNIIHLFIDGLFWIYGVGWDCFLVIEWPVHINTIWW